MKSQLGRMVLQVGFALLLAACCAGASTDSWWFTRAWQTDDGLLNNNIHAIVQSRDGFLWVATPTSLMRFDGISFSPFPVKNITGLIPHNIRTVLYDRNGVLWIVPNLGGMTGVNPDFSIARLPKSGLPTNAPTTLAEGGDDSMWLGYSRAIYRIKDGLVTHFGTKDGMPATGRPSLASDGTGHIWLAKGNRICAFQNDRFLKIASAPIECLAGSHTNTLWFVDNGRLFACDIKGVIQNYGAFEISDSVPAVALLEDHTGAMWIGTDGNGLFRYSESGFERIETSHSTILSLAEDSDGNIWAGTGGGGLDRIFLNSVRLENDPALGEIQSICETTNAVLWGATHNGALVSRINGHWQSVCDDAPFAGIVKCVAADAAGGIWIGTRNGQIFRLLNNQYTEWKPDRTRGSIVGLLPAADGALWLVDRNSCYTLRGGHWTDMRLPRPVDGISAIAEDARGNIWVGARGAVIRFDGKHFVDESPGLPISDRNICCLYGTPDGSMWISCGGIGLLRYKDGLAGQIGSQQGLYNDYISQIVADNHGWLWFASDLGIFKIRQRDLQQAMQQPDTRVRPILYGRNEGLLSVEALFSTASPNVVPLAIHTHDGRVWLLTHAGIVVADPNGSPDNYSPPPLLLTRVAMDGQIIASYGDVVPTNTIANLETVNAPLDLPAGFRHLEFDFTAFHFSDPENIHFRYQLSGFDNGWIDAGTGRAATYSRLAAGDYQFHVEACIGDGSWSETPAQLAFTVAPFFWQTWWFRVGAGVLLSALLAAVVRYISFRQLRLKLRALEQQAAVERERGRIARDIHDDLGNRLTKIELLTGLAQLDQHVPEKSVAHIQQISSTARQATNALDEIVWAINPQNDTVQHLVSYLGQFSVEFLRTAGIGYRVDLPDFPPPNPVSAEVRHNLFLVVKESLNNIVCHARASQVSLAIAVTDKSICVMIDDNGRGFGEEAQNNGGNGLKNMRERMAEIGGEFQVKTAPAAGTRVSFSCPCQIKK